VDDLAFGWAVPFLLLLALGWLLWITGVVLWVRVNRRRGDRDGERPYPGGCAVILPWTLLMLPSLLSGAVMLWANPRVAVLEPASPAGCRAVLEDRLGRGKLYYATGLVGRAVESGASWSADQYADPRPIERGTWSLRWEGETAVLDVWGDDHAQAQNAGVEPCRPGMEPVRW
jgi:hypothetical protein